MMTLHKLSAGDGYTYLTRQVARDDIDGVSGRDLDRYYSQRGETPGRWLGQGLGGLATVVAGDTVSEVQMRSLFGAGRHPDADRMRAHLVAGGVDPQAAHAAARLGRPFPNHLGNLAFRTRCEAAYTAARRHGTALTDDVRAGIRTRVAAEMFTEKHGRAPTDGEELHSYVTRLSRRATAVAGYDLTFSPVKSVSALWALVPREAALAIEAAHHAAVAATIAWLEREAIFTRTGHAGVRQVDTTGVLAAAFTHRDTRTGDPDLHTHVAVANKVQTRDGAWLAIDGRTLHKAARAASHRYDTLLEGELQARLGLVFAARPQADPRRRPIREIAGVDPDLVTLWSSRRRDIQAARAELERDFAARHGRSPTPAEGIKLGQQANLVTRDPKHAPRTLAEQRAAWRAQAIDALGVDAPGRRDRMAYGMTRVAALLARAQTAAQDIPVVTPDKMWVEGRAGELVASLEAERATWQRWHVLAEAARIVRRDNIIPDQRGQAIDALTAVALSPGHSVRLAHHDGDSCGDMDGDIDCDIDIDVAGAGAVGAEGAEIGVPRRASGESQYTVTGAQLYSSVRILAAEHRLLTAAARDDGHAVPMGLVELALSDAATAGRRLNDGQSHLVRQLAGSGKRLEVALAPAGSGKTTALAVLAAAWRADRGTVLGLAPTAVAAAGLTDHISAPNGHAGGQVDGHIDGHCDTLAKLTWHAHHRGGAVPEWLDRVDHRTLVLIDEAGMAGTLDLDAAVNVLLGRGATIRLIGDDQQLASVAAGGILTDIARNVGAASLKDLVRFTDPDEAAATLAVRDGNPTAAAFYLDRGRVTIGTRDLATDAVVNAWKTDHASGVETLMLAATRELVADLNTRARVHLRRARSADGSDGSVGAAGPRHEVEVVLADGCLAGVGDVVITRRNDRRSRLAGGDYVRNGYRWRITALTPQGSMTVLQVGTGRSATLDRDYVAENVELGYATTIHAAQGMTVDSAHLLATPGLSRQLLYVALSRGREVNTVHLISDAGDDPTRPEATRAPMAAECLTGMITRDGGNVSAAAAGRPPLPRPAGPATDARFHAGHAHAGHHRAGRVWSQSPNP